MSDPLAIAGSAGVLAGLWSSRPWLHAEALDALAELNEQCLELLCEQVAVCGARSRPALLGHLEALWVGLETAARHRAARCPFLLVDAGFTRSCGPSWLSERGVRDRDWPEDRGGSGARNGMPGSAAFFTVPRTIAVTRLVLTYAWHLARSESVAARVFLGMSARCADGIAACTLRQIIQLAESEPQLLRPRWSERLEVWRELLIAASGGETGAMERFGMRGLQLLAAEAREGEERAEYVK